MFEFDLFGHWAQYLPSPLSLPPTGHFGLSVGTDQRIFGFKLETFLCANGFISSKDSPEKPKCVPILIQHYILDSDIRTIVWSRNKTLQSGYVT